MFIVLSALICFSLLAFGAVRLNSWFVIPMVWLGVIGASLIYAAVRRHAWRTTHFVLLAAAVVLIGFVQSRLAIGAVAGMFAWFAASEGESKTLRFFKVLMVIGLLEAVLALVQFFIIPGWIFGYINPSHRVSGSLINNNHFAGLLEMLIPVAIGLAYDAAGRFENLAQSYLYLLGGAFMGLALVFTMSRMGIFSFLMTVLLLAVVLRMQTPHRTLSAGLAFGLIGLVLAGALWIGVDAVVERYANLAAEDAILLDGRLLVFQDVIRMIRANPWGVGVGNFQNTFRAYQTFRPDLTFDHAHNDYLETAAEWGLFVAAVFWAFLFFVVVRAIRAFAYLESPGQRGILLACIGAMFSILVHSLADFNLQIPSNAMLFFTLVGISLAIPVRKANA